MSFATTNLTLILNSLMLAGIYILAALGLSLIFGVLGVVNFGHGAFVMVGGFMAWYGFVHFGVDPLISVFVVVPVLFTVGYYLQATTIKHVIGDDEMYSLLLTFGVAMVIEGVFLQLFSGLNRSIQYLNGNVQVLSVTVGVNKLVAGTTGTVFAVALILFLHKSKYGQAIRATAQEAALAEACGIDTNRIRAITFGIGTALAGIAGVAYLMVYSITPIVGQEILLLLFVIIVLGGLDSIAGTVIAGVVISLFQSYVVYYVGSHTMYFLLFISIAVILLVRPHGLLGEPEGRHA